MYLASLLFYFIFKNQIITKSLSLYITTIKQKNYKKYKKKGPSLAKIL